MKITTKKDDRHIYEIHEFDRELSLDDFVEHIVCSSFQWDGAVIEEQSNIFTFTGHTSEVGQYISNLVSRGYLLRTNKVTFITKIY